MTQITLAKGITMGLRKAMEADPKVLVMGEDVGKLGGVFRVTDGLQKDFGEDRVIDTPLAESGIIGTAIGLALRGYRPVCEIQFDGFVYPAFDQIVSQLAKMRARALGKVSLPVVVRIPVGGGIGAVEHHSESNEAYFAHTAGLKVVACSNPVDAYFMVQQAVASDDPVILYEPKRRYWEKADLDESLTLDSAMSLYSARVAARGRHHRRRLLCGGGIGAVELHSEFNEAYFAHTAGLKVVVCSNPVDAYFMIQQAIASDDPVILYEPKRRYWEKADLDESLTLDSALPLYSARVVREGTDITVAAYGPMVKTCMEAATAAAEEGKSLEVIDLRSLSPLDMPTLRASVEKTGRLVVVHEAPVFLGMGSEVAARVTEQCFYSLEAPVLRVCGFDTPYPPSRVEEEYLPDLDRVLDAVDRSLAF